MKLFSKRAAATNVVRTELADLVAALTEVLPVHVPMNQRPDSMYPEDVLLEWRPEAEGASILDVGWEASGIDIQIGFSTGYFDLLGPVPDQGRADARLETLVELAEAIALGRMVAFTETTRKARVETTVFGCRSGPRLYRSHERAKGAPDTYRFFAPW
ncbi:hypothetical protein [Arthrobacter crystallopoietes]|uniref:hypothetical protein n=1 Tax=Crystallibacter crystallopoietes TaxID=37928 RepID=UPI001ABE8AD3|nr:hypothetical protein [Arthrobacter crystallopoietes]QTG81541.1 hypothetical protein J5251_02715 [Arthrobacter crystallopoietes]